ncbi:hypothetical protein C8R43DRAFT_958934 [Mycena crocata]|nr:hypothetical protein C8R43DRAFT_958934 [Mycena crocata]
MDDESTASRVFAIQELLLLVLAYISPVPSGKPVLSFSVDTTSLANLARVSQNISDVVLDVLWRSLHRPDAIVRLLPVDAYELVRRDDWDKDTNPMAEEYRLKRPLNSKDFTAFDKYAPRIRFVDFSSGSKVLRRGCELFPHIKAFRDPILPFLANFRWEVSSHSIGAFSLLSREASLPSQAFSLLMFSEIEHTPGESDVIAKTIDAFNDAALPWLPDVKKLVVRTVHHLPAATTAIHNLSGLEHFSCDLRLEPALFKHLAALPCLRFMDLRWIPTNAVTALSRESQSFCALRGLRISGTLPSISALLPLVSSPNLLSVHVVIKDLQSQSIEPSLFSLLIPPSVPARTSTLQHFILAGPFNRDGPHVGRLVLSSFAPLYACRALQTFRVDIDAAHIVFTDDDVRTMARAWPDIVVLQVMPPRASPPTSDVHLYTLWAFAVGCPRLRILVLGVNADVSRPFVIEEQEGTVAAHHQIMQELTLFWSPCGDPALVTHFLKVAFTKLSADVFHPYPPRDRLEDREKWEVVVAGLPA